MDRRTSGWVQQTVGVDEEIDLLSVVKKRRIRKYGHWK